MMRTNSLPVSESKSGQVWTYHHDLSAHHANGPQPLLIWIWVSPRRRHGIVEHEDRGHEAEAVRSKFSSFFADPESNASAVALYHTTQL